MHVDFGVLGPVTAWDDAGNALSLKGPRHRAVLARLIIARRRVVPVSRLVEDLWVVPPVEAVSSIRTFVAGLRRALEPDRPPRTPARLLVTEGPGYALRPAQDDVDAWKFEHAVESVADLQPAQVVDRLTAALGSWRGPAFADFADEPWARGERSRLTELRLNAVERRAEAQIALGAPAEAIPELDAHIAEHPWREDAWQLLVLALYRSGRQSDALSVVRRARRMLNEHLGVDPGPRLRRLEADILQQADYLDPGPGGTAAQVWAEAAAAYESTVPSRARTRLESTAGLMRGLAVTGGGGLEAARRHRVAAVAAAEQLGDPELTARVIGVFDVPAIWTRSDDPEQARWLVGAAERTLQMLPVEEHEAARARLLATIAVESRGTLAREDATSGAGARAFQAARQSEHLARRLGDDSLLVFALNGLFMQTFHRAGLAGRRDAIGTEIVALAAKNDLTTYEVLGHLIRLQARCALADFSGADRHAQAADALALRHELPLVSVFTSWYRALRTALVAPLAEARSAYQDAAVHLEGAGMPGLQSGLLPMALLSVYVRHGVTMPVGEEEWGPYEPWVRPLLLVMEGRDDEARAALQGISSPPRDLLFEALWCLIAKAAIAVGEQSVMERASTQLEPAASELAGAGSGLISMGPVSGYLEELRAARGQN
ncbi:AfsR/SARP family transcriptional regulator [Streptomyces sp. NBC_00568]|uniref:AfsR/SARP family transcriptional regulator n=1 Tax=Streptomyces sp. NBC_00568 TaxID=2975779 RepID=UPI002259D493|nr:AfsR/SARP family transcriptional regulator [Streptomyces sp. NBC_00568]MCX4993541.1 AfsR/SARP family transcriptional regulator [Streptomyces sp. NBC_00568]